MELLLDMTVPVLIAAVALYGMLRRVDVYDALVHGAGDGLGAEAIVFTNERGILGMTPGAGGMLARLKQGCADA